MVKLSQVFLHDPNIAKKIVESAELKKSDIVIEIGAGKGILTQYIQPKVKKLIVVEIDKFLCQLLREKFKDEKVKIVEGDFLKVKIDKLTKSKRIKFISNLPYHIASPILEKILPDSRWSKCIFMVQKEYGERMLAKHGSKKYSPLSIFTQFYSIPKLLFYVPKTCFYPQPEVDSVVIKLTKRKPPEVDKEIFFKLVKTAFQHRRKTILNSLCYSLNLDRELIRNELAKSNINASLRPEDISIDEYLRLARYLKYS